MIKVKFTVRKDDVNDFPALVERVRNAVCAKEEVVMHEFTIVPIQVTLEVEMDIPVLTVEGYIK